MEPEPTPDHGRDSGSRCVFFHIHSWSKLVESGELDHVVEHGTGDGSTWAPTVDDLLVDCDHRRPFGTFHTGKLQPSPADELYHYAWVAFEHYLGAADASHRTMTGDGMCPATYYVSGPNQRGLSVEETGVQRFEMSDLDASLAALCTGTPDCVPSGQNWTTRWRRMASLTVYEKSGAKLPARDIRHLYRCGEPRSVSQHILLRPVGDYAVPVAPSIFEVERNSTTVRTFSVRQWTAKLVLRFGEYPYVLFCAGDTGYAAAVNDEAVRRYKQRNRDKQIGDGRRSTTVLERVGARLGISNLSGGENYLAAQSDRHANSHALVRNGVVYWARVILTGTGVVIALAIGVPLVISPMLAPYVKIPTIVTTAGAGVAAQVGVAMTVVVATGAAVRYNQAALKHHLRKARGGVRERFRSLVYIDVATSRSSAPPSGGAIDAGQMRSLVADLVVHGPKSFVITDAAYSNTSMIIVGTERDCHFPRTYDCLDLPLKFSTNLWDVNFSIRDLRREFSARVDLMRTDPLLIYVDELRLGRVEGLFPVWFALVPNRCAGDNRHNRISVALNRLLKDMGVTPAHQAVGLAQNSVKGAIFARAGEYFTQNPLAQYTAETGDALVEKSKKRSVYKNLMRRVGAPLHAGVLLRPQRYFQVIPKIEKGVKSTRAIQALRPESALNTLEFLNWFNEFKKAFAWDAKPLAQGSMWLHDATGCSTGRVPIDLRWWCCPGSVVGELTAHVRQFEMTVLAAVRETKAAPDANDRAFADYATHGDDNHVFGYTRVGGEQYLTVAEGDVSRWDSCFVTPLVEQFLELLAHTGCPQRVIDELDNQYSRGMLLPLGLMDQPLKFKPRDGLRAQKSGMTPTTAANSEGQGIITGDSIINAGLLGNDCAYGDDPAGLATRWTGEFANCCMTLKFRARVYKYDPSYDGSDPTAYLWNENHMPNYSSTFLKGAFARNDQGVPFYCARNASCCTKAISACQIPVTEAVSTRRLRITDPDAAALLYLAAMAREITGRPCCQFLVDLFDRLLPDGHLEEQMRAFGYNPGEYPSPEVVSRSERFRTQLSYTMQADYGNVSTDEAPERATQAWTDNFIRERYDLTPAQVGEFMATVTPFRGRTIHSHYVLRRLFQVDY